MCCSSVVDTRCHVQQAQSNELAYPMSLANNKHISRRLRSGKRLPRIPRRHANDAAMSYCYPKIRSTAPRSARHSHAATRVSNISSPVHVHKAAVVAPRVECEALGRADHDERFATSVMESHRSDREGRLVVTWWGKRRPNSASATGIA